MASSKALLSLAADLLEHVKRPIGVFDSGVGGLSILKALRAELPFENFIYVADSGFAPYGERDEGFVLERARAITRHLIRQPDLAIQALVIACNTATAAAIHLLRQDHPELPIIGVEPALKPAIALSQTGRIGVMATRGTLNSQKFKALQASLADQAQFICQPCDGLADAIERNDTDQITALCTQYTMGLGRFGSEPGAVDTLVLGCTHYPFASQILQSLLGPKVHLVDNGEPVARQTRRMLTSPSMDATPGQCQLFSTGSSDLLQSAAKRWLGLDVSCRLL
ncbi:glutamate racemase [Rhodoferax sp.]|uniref:glutamate racemase n=1 Tax=Rhodoferax sp. TaxID=50421 RepID=UPI002614CA9E|nr:glutamate racemase [Rhodoferax sp.]MDD2918094.1 glutamate racemase [Rhodoferax sp.]